MRFTVTLTGIFDEPYRNKDGSWSFEIAGQILSEDAQAMVRELLPDLGESFGQLLAKQAVLNCVR